MRHTVKWVMRCKIMLWCMCYVVLCCAMFCYGVLRCAMLHYVLVCDFLLCDDVLCCTMFQYVILCCAALCYVAVSSVMLRQFALYGNVSFSFVLHCANVVLFGTRLFAKKLESPSQNGVCYSTHGSFPMICRRQVLLDKNT